jgi:lipopolysaccharide transport system permease protein
VVSDSNPMTVLPGVAFRIQPSRPWWRLNLREIWAYRELLYFFVWRDIKVRYKQTVIGVAWAVIQPAMTMAVFCVFFGYLAQLPSNGRPYPVFYYSALLPWMYFANALAQVTATMIDQQHVITKVYFPRLILPLAAVLSGLVDFALAFTVLIALMLYYGIVPTVNIVLLPAFVMLAVMTALGAGLWLSALNVLYRDVRYALPFFIQFWMFASPVIYPSSLLPERWQAFYGLNPMVGVIEGFRWVLLGQDPPSGMMLAPSIAVIAVLCLGGLVYFQKMEGTLADVV